jgi:hypothetical protein
MRSSRARLQATAAARAFSTAVALLVLAHPATAFHGVHMAALPRSAAIDRLTILSH